METARQGKCVDISRISETSDATSRIDLIRSTTCDLVHFLHLLPLNVATTR